MYTVILRKEISDWDIKPEDVYWSCNPTIRFDFACTDLIKYRHHYSAAKRQETIKQARKYLKSIRRERLIEESDYMYFVEVSKVNADGTTEQVTQEKRYIKAEALDCYLQLKEAYQERACKERECGILKKDDIRCLHD